MRALLIYWLLGCFLVGSGAALHQKRCPNEPETTGIQALVMIAIWPAGIFAFIFGDKELPPCKL